MAQAKEPQTAPSDEAPPDVPQRHSKSPTRRVDTPSSTEETLNDQPETVVSQPQNASSSREPEDSAFIDVEKLARTASATAGLGPEDLLPKDESTTTNDPNIVWWDGDNDPENPYNWPSWRKVVNCSLISALTFLTPLASSIFAPGVPSLMADFGRNDNLLAAFVVSVYVLGFAVGPMVLAPLSEMYGRTPVYHVCNVAFIGFVVGCALAPTLEALIVFRFLSGTFGSCPLTNGGGSIADMITQEKRAGAMAAFSLGPLVGPVIGPVIGGVLADKVGWRWAFWVVAICGGVISVGMAFTLRETYAPTILERKAERLRKETGNEQLRSKLDTGLTTKQLWKVSIIRPLKLLFLSPISTIFAVFFAILYGYLYLLFSTIPFVFQRSYGFSTSTVGLVYLGLGIGSLAGMVWFGIDSTQEVKKNKDIATGEAKPEVRLKLLPIGTILLPIGFFIYGWTADFETHWMGPIIGLTIIGVGESPSNSVSRESQTDIFAGNIICFMGVSMYLMESYMRYAASALAANTVVRSIAGAVLPLCALDMYDALGLGWGNSLLGFIAVALIPVPFLIKKYGEKLRTGYGPKNL